MCSFIFNIWLNFALFPFHLADNKWPVIYTITLQNTSVPSLSICQIIPEYVFIPPWDSHGLHSEYKFHLIIRCSNKYNTFSSSTATISRQEIMATSRAWFSVAASPKLTRVPAGCISLLYGSWNCLSQQRLIEIILRLNVGSNNIKIATKRYFILAIF